MGMTNYGEKFASRVLRKFYEIAVAPYVTNQDWEGEIKGGKTDRVNILSFLGDVTLGDYSVGSDMSLQHMVDTEEQLIVNQKKYYNFDIDDLDKFFSYVDDESSTLLENAAKALETKIDTYVLGFHTDVKAGNRVGTVGTVAGNGDTTKVTITGATGAVVGTGSTAFAAGMVGKGFRAITAGASTVWYRVATFTDTTHITVTNWDGTLPLTDGDHGGTGAGYEVEAMTAVQVTKATIYAQIVDLGAKLTKGGSPLSDRWMVVSPDIGSLVRQAPELIPAVAVAYQNVVLEGIIGKINGFTVYENNNVAGNGTTGWYLLAGQKSFITFAQSFVKSRVVEPTLQFAQCYQGLNVYGAKVPILRRPAGAYLFGKL